MPGLLASQGRCDNLSKELLDCDVLSPISHQVLVRGLVVSVQVVERRYFQQKKKRIPYAHYGYPDLISYLASICGIKVTMNSTNGQYQVEADDCQYPSNLNINNFIPNALDLI